ncbi:hypothetical protein Q0F99_17645 [Rathayibacter oskolensis]|nr:hypothetical protein [Rathayibacter oskolensis]WKK71267.1 hypothetical protein Q0F99_17645 [Rathayibacter oskolensis]
MATGSPECFAASSEAKSPSAIPMRARATPSSASRRSTASAADRSFP